MMKLIKNNLLKKISLSFLILIIPFFEFINVNFYKIDSIVYKQLSIYMLVTFILFYLSFYFFYIFSKNIEKTICFFLTISFSFWIFFKFEPIRLFTSSMTDLFIKSSILQLFLALFFLIVTIIIFFLLIKKNRYSKIFFSFFSYFILIQLLVLMFNLFFLIKNNFFDKELINKNTLTPTSLFSNKEIEKIRTNKDNKNIYFIIMDGMASLEQYEFLLREANFFSDKTQKYIKDNRQFFLKKNFTYIENSYSTFNDTHHTLGSIMNLKPLELNKLNKKSLKYQNLLYPAVLTKNKFEINNFPNLIEDLYKIDYDFKWLGYKLNCKFVNPNLCYDYENKKSYKNKSIINFYILKSFLINTPTLELYGFFRNKLKIDITLPDREKIKLNEKNDLNSRNEVLSEFILNVKKYQKNNINYFYFIHNILPSDPFIFDEDCNKKNHVKDDGDMNIYLKNYSKNYKCALKKIKEFIEFIDLHDPDAIVVFQADHGEKITLNRNNNKYKIFNLIKVPNLCKKYLTNEIDSVNAVRLSINCATGTKVKLLKRKIYSE